MLFLSPRHQSLSVTLSPGKDVMSWKQTKKKFLALVHKNRSLTGDCGVSWIAQNAWEQALENGRSFLFYCAVSQSFLTFPSQHRLEGHFLDRKQREKQRDWKLFSIALYYSPTQVLILSEEWNKAHEPAIMLKNIS